MSSLYIFTRDLRVNDNSALIEANKNSTRIAPIFVFTPEQVDKNKYKSSNAIQFMVESLHDLNKQLNNGLSLFYGEHNNIVDQLLKRVKFKQVYITKDYTPYAKKREDALKQVCDKHKVEFCCIDDYCLNVPGTILTKTGTPYQKYTPYYRSALKVEPRKIIELKKLKKRLKLKSNYNFKKAGTLFTQNNDINMFGGREYGLKQLALLKDQKDYGKTRNDLELQTSNLSAYIKFGNVSIREVYWKVRSMFGKNHPIIAQLIWHDFYYQIGVAFPRVFGSSLKEKYDKIVWSDDKSTLKAWQTGRTGYPVVDAAMTQLNETGYMHNRGRLIVASFLVKTLLHSWQDGEQYFAQQLSDYDPLVNNGNWQWIYGGADSQPYFRIFNPWLQSGKFDPKGTYIKKWLPQLSSVPAKQLHEWFKYCDEYKGKIDYPAPIVDYKKAKDKVLKAIKKALY